MTEQTKLKIGAFNIAFPMLIESKQVFAKMKFVPLSMGFNYVTQIVTMTGVSDYFEDFELSTENDVPMYDVLVYTRSKGRGIKIEVKRMDGGVE